MGLKIDGSIVMSEILAFHASFTKVAATVDVDGFDLPYDSVNTNIGDQCLVYKLGNRRVEVGVVHCDLHFRYFTKDELVLESVFPQRDVEGKINSALRWLVGQPISVQPLPEKVIRITSPEDGKHYDTVDIVVQINSSYEVRRLYDAFKKHGMSYKQDTGGPLKMISKINGREQWVSPLIHTIAGVRVLYIQPTSGLVYWPDVETWVAQRVPDGVRTLLDPGSLVCEIRSHANYKASEAV